jgi:hypothetical protein
MGTGDSFPGEKRPEREAGVKNAWNCTSSPPTLSCRGTYLSTGTTLPLLYLHKPVTIKSVCVFVCVNSIIIQKLEVKAVLIVI